MRPLTTTTPPPLQGKLGSQEATWWCSGVFCLKTAQASVAPLHGTAPTPRQLVPPLPELATVDGAALALAVAEKWSSRCSRAAASRHCCALWHLGHRSHDCPEQVAQHLWHVLIPAPCHLVPNPTLRAPPKPHDAPHPLPPPHLQGELGSQEATPSGAATVFFWRLKIAR